MKQILPVFAVLLLIAAATAQAGTITSIDASCANTSYVGGTGVLTMNGACGININYTGGTVTVSGTFSMTTNLSSDSSSGGIADGNFTGGSFAYKDSANNTLLSGNITSFHLVEAYNNSGMFWGDGLFTVTGGSLQTDFGYASGTMVDISYSIQPVTVADFSTSFAGSSNMVVLPVPEPVTVVFLSLGSLVILQRRKHS